MRLTSSSLFCFLIGSADYLVDIAYELVLLINYLFDQFWCRYHHFNCIEFEIMFFKYVMIDVHLNVHFLLPALASFNSHWFQTRFRHAVPQTNDSVKLFSFTLILRATLTPYCNVNVCSTLPNISLWSLRRLSVRLTALFRVHNSRNHEYSKRSYDFLYVQKAFSNDIDRIFRRIFAVFESVIRWNLV